ncbi:MAG TPA: DNA primase [Burkholderiales bacterium]|nr:DNA primase [Burkholderiales bacterium]
MIPDSFKQELLHRVDIVDVIERYVPLKKSGANHLACCPFHSEKTPSFTVSPAKQFYHCFGCGAHGNAISFLMEYQGLGYVEAVKDLAESAGMKMPEFEPRENKPEAGADLYAIMERACDYYRDQLKAAPRAIEYLKGRGLTGKIAGRFGIGYAPGGWQNLESVFPDYADKALKDAGLVIDPEGGGRRYDRFRDRIMFPILNQRGSVIAFGGRVLGEGEPKYLNSPETPLFEKGRELYGLAQARSAIRAAGRVIVVEGYMDVVALAQHGVEYAVATLGTATSVTHVQKLLRQTDEVVFCFDGDAAGRKAAWHALEVSLPHLADNKAMRFLFLPPEHDPDSYVREKGKEAFEKILETTRPLSEFFVEELMGRVELKTYEGRAQLVHEAKPLLKQISARTLQRQLIQMIAATGYLDEGQAAQLTQELTKTRLAAPARGVERGAQAPELRLVRILLQCLISKPALAKELSPELLDQSSPEARALVAVAEFCREKPETEGNIVVDHFQGTEFRSLLESSQAALLDTKLEAEHMEVDFRGALECLQDKQRQQRFEALRVKPGRTPEEEAEMLRLLRERKQTPASASNNAIISGSRAIS